MGGWRTEVASNTRNKSIATSFVSAAFTGSNIEVSSRLGTYSGSSRGIVTEDGTSLVIISSERVQ